MKKRSVNRRRAQRRDPGDRFYLPLKREPPGDYRTWRRGVLSRLRKLIDEAYALEIDAREAPYSIARETYPRITKIYEQAADLALDAGWTSTSRWREPSAFPRKAEAYRRAARRMREMMQGPWRYVPKLALWSAVDQSGKKRRPDFQLLTVAGTFSMPWLRAHPGGHDHYQLMFVEAARPGGYRRTHFIDRYGENVTPSGGGLVEGDLAFRRPESAVVAARRHFNRLTRYALPGPPRKRKKRRA